MTLRGDLGEIHHAGLCTMRRGLGAHVVRAGRHGPVTRLVMPGEAVDRPRSFSRSGLRGVILQIGEMSAAIVGAPNEPIEERVGRALAAGSV